MTDHESAQRINFASRMMRVPVTGIGVVAPGAIGVDAFRAMLAEGRSAIADVDRFDVEGLRGSRAALVRDFKARDFIAPMKMRRMNGLSRLGIPAARMAVDHGEPVHAATTRVTTGT